VNYVKLKHEIRKKESRKYIIKYNIKHGIWRKITKKKCDLRKRNMQIATTQSNESYLHLAILVGLLV